MRKLELNELEVEALLIFLYDAGYISHEFHPVIHLIAKKLEDFHNGSSLYRNTERNDELAEEGSTRED